MNPKHLMLLPAIFLLLFGWLFIPVRLDNPFSMAYVVLHTAFCWHLVVLTLEWAGSVRQNA